MAVDCGKFYESANEVNPQLTTTQPMHQAQIFNTMWEALIMLPNYMAMLNICVFEGTTIVRSKKLTSVIE